MTLSPETKHRLQWMNTFIHDGESPIEPLEPERPEWNRRVCFWATFATVMLGLFLFARAVGLV